MPLLREALPKNGQLRVVQIVGHEAKASKRPAAEDKQEEGVLDLLAALKRSVEGQKKGAGRSSRASRPRPAAKKSA